MDQLWLVRTATNNLIHGPYTTSQLCQMILDGHCQLQDEICSGTNYWITLSEDKELWEQLHIQFPVMPLRTSEEDTVKTDIKVLQIKPPPFPAENLIPRGMQWLSWIIWGLIVMSCLIFGALFLKGLHS